MDQDIKIAGEPKSQDTCQFTVDRPVYPDKAYSFSSKDMAAGSSLAERIFAIDGVSSLVISHDRITVTKSGPEEWPAIGKQIGSAIREHIASGQEAVGESLRATLPSEDEIRAKVQEVLDEEINPAVAGHGGIIQLIDVRENVVFIHMGGGCQGCGMANVTLKQGVEVAVRASVPEVAEILDATDHASGRNPYYAPSKK
jgi:Fe-S cluster biogenesis protein NfuA